MKGQFGQRKYFNGNSTSCKGYGLWEKDGIDLNNSQHYFGIGD